MNPILEVHDLSFSYNPDEASLKNISFRLMEKERLGIIGGNGAGKSTLLWCLLGLLKSGGTIRLFGEKVTKKSLMRVGMVFQNPEDQLFMPSILDDAALPLVNSGRPIVEARKVAQEKLDQLGLGKLAQRPATKLSIGERKRASIAAVLSTSPDLIVLDEPTAELDGRASSQLTVLLAHMSIASIVTSHDINFLKTIATRVLVLYEGEVLAEGPASKVLSDLNLLQAARLV
jgi:cobalt/nickel transport system ATP-binding protein